MAIRTYLFGLFIGAFCGACDKEVSSPAETVPQAVPQAVVASESVPGSIVFTIGQVEHRFDFLPDAANFYLPGVSAVSAKPAFDALEELTLNFLYMDIKTLEFPVALRNRTGIIYIDSEGTEWAGPAHVTLESLSAGGILKGSFTNVSLPQSNKSMPNVILSSGRIEVQLERL